ncbi:MAG: NAD(P)H-hydrate dehydratase [Hyphomonas sp.]
MGRLIITPQQMLAAEKAAIEAGVDSFDLMKRAGLSAAEFVHQNWPLGRIQVLCGPGGNGGDGFVAAANLVERWRDVRVFCSVPVEQLTGDAAKAAAMWTGEILPLEAALEAPTDIVIDALFGTGFSRPLEGAALALAQRGGVVASIDVPSGIDGLRAIPLGPCFMATATLTFAALKPAHMLHPAAGACGKVVAADIGVATDSSWIENVPSLWMRQMPNPGPLGHKHSRGHMKVLSGGVASTGAARLTARAGLRIGAGLVTVLSPPSALIVNASQLTAVMVSSVADIDAFKRELDSAKSVVVGPGAGVTQGTYDRVIAALESEATVILDADALTVFEDKPTALFQALRKTDVLTPHIGEFRRLFGDLLEKSDNKIDAVIEAAKQAGCIVLLKGQDTVIADAEGRVVVNNHAASWLATAGSGDVLAGFISGLICQGMEPLLATAMATWVHGEASRRIGAGLISEDLEQQVPNILSALHGEFG